MTIGEFDLIKRYFQHDGGAIGVIRGVGDDCALLQVPQGCQLAVSMDTLVAGVHFPANADPELIAERALRVNLSDLAAMGADPLWFTLGLTLPQADERWVQAFSRGLLRVAESHNLSLVGGDTTRGPLSITIQVHGAVEPGDALVRGEASVGDWVFVTGPLGDGAAALAVIKKQLEVGTSAFNYFMDSYYRPQPRVSMGQALHGVASAAIDVSDGLMADLGHICEESVVGAHIDLAKVPMSDPVKKLVSLDKGLQWALSGGDDYELCFTVPPTKLDKLDELIKRKRVQAIHIGTITKGSEVVCTYKDKPVSIKRSGYQHFASKPAATLSDVDGNNEMGQASATETND